MYKDLAKYWIGFVPVASVLSLGVVLAPDADQIAQVGVADWLHQRWGVAVALVVVLAVLGGITWTCARVLAAEPTNFGTLLSDDAWLSKAFSKYGVGRPYFLDSTQFKDAELHSREPGDNGEFDARASAVNDVTARVSALSAELNAKSRFTLFGWTFGVGIVVVLGAVLFALGRTQSLPEIITDPTAVAMHVPAGAESAVSVATGCRVPADATVVAVGGTWARPELRLFGDGCLDTIWVPSDALHIVLTRS